MTTDVVLGFQAVAQRLRTNGVEVQEQPDWETRGKEALTPMGMVWHHTATSGGPSAGLNIVTYGMPGLENALCNWYCERGAGAALWIVAARTAWHAGAGGYRNLSRNSQVIGIECENDGGGELWHPDALAAQAALGAELGAVFGIPPVMHCEHYEWTTRKIDRRGISGSKWRARINSYQGGHDMLNDDDKAWIRATMLDIVRKEGISGAADAGASNVDDVILARLDQMTSGAVDYAEIGDAVATELARRLEA